MLVVHNIGILLSTQKHEVKNFYNYLPGWHASNLWGFLGFLGRLGGSPKLHEPPRHRGESDALDPKRCFANTSRRHRFGAIQLPGEGHGASPKMFLVGGFNMFQPTHLKNMLVKLDHFPRVWGEK